MERFESNPAGRAILHIRRQHDAGDRNARIADLYQAAQLAEQSGPAVQAQVHGNCRQDRWADTKDFESTWIAHGPLPTWLTVAEQHATN